MTETAAKVNETDTNWRFWIDRGGTFTDLIGMAADGRLVTRKLLSENPERYEDAAIAGIKDVLGVPLSEPVPSERIHSVRMGTTVATNALLERKGTRTALVINRGLGDVLRIGSQARPRLFDLAIVLPSMLYETVIEVDGRIGVDGIETAPLDEKAVRTALLAAKSDGVEAVAIALMHGWKSPAHEQRIAAIAREAGFTQISTSHAVSPLLRLVPRGDTTVVDAYLSPILRRYVDRVARALDGARLYFMQSHGGLAEASSFEGKDAILSGPAGGIVGAARSAEAAGFERIIGFDMGGTSTDVALYDGAFERSFDTEIAGTRVRVPMMAINTVAAGGGSILHFDGARFRVGPDSAGANPGPACYRRGGPLTVTDANLCLGKIQPAHFPAVFGPDGDQSLDAEIVRERFSAVAREVARTTGITRSAEEIAEGFLDIAIANMVKAIKQISVQKGRDPQRFALACFGGAGGQHACLVAEALDMDSVFIHKFAGVLSAFGMGLADLGTVRQRAIERALTTADTEIATAIEQLSDETRTVLIGQGGDAGAIRTAAQLHLRYEATEAILPIAADAPDREAAFTTAHEARFGFAIPGRPIIVDAVSVEATSPGETVEERTPPHRDAALAPIDTVSIWSRGEAHRACVYDRTDLRPGDSIPGPAMICDANATTIVEPGWVAEIAPPDNLILRRRAEARRRTPDADAPPDPVLLELFNNLFMSVAEQAGAVLQNTAQSVNIRERLDFSCAVFDSAGRLVANAPHVPVHLGSMSESVRHVIRTRGNTLRPGDVIALNNPSAGGTHLPDITVITPVFDAGGKEIRFFTGARGHHADVGGITPGSTPPNATTLVEEGVLIDDFLLVDQGTFREDAFRALLLSARYPARSPDQNIADIKAQIASNRAAAKGLDAIVVQHGWPLVSAYLRHVMDNAAEHVRRVIDRIGDGQFIYRMDDSSVIAVRVAIDRAARRATVDFTGTSPQHKGNFNAPRAITQAAVLYAFRCLVGEDIPLNEGCLEPIDLIIPEGSFLDPAPGAAVVAGNTEVSQAVCNAVFGALGAVACSQATMNNFLFGDAKRQYYETICGGAGAGPGFAGASAVHTHMTNTRMTDPEVMELNYPVTVEEFSIRRGSGGAGASRGGDGAIRRLRFHAPMTAVIVASRREVPPFGLDGGEDGATGKQWIERADGTRESLPGRAEAAIAPGDIFGIATPGGGGYGRRA
ncbi:MAG TPA: hydantoinase B/oxoprolinase family protein [Acidiphilium sp.]